MIEDAMLVAVGFCGATLIALACLPAVWHRAVRLTRRRLEMLVPLSEAEIAAERDGIRAEAAVSQRRLEQKLERAERTASTASLRLGGRTAELSAAEIAHDATRDAGRLLAAELAQTKQNLAQSENQCRDLQLTLGTTELQLQKSDEDRRQLNAVIAKLNMHGEENRVALAALATRNAELHARLDELGADLRRLGRESDQHRETAALHLTERDDARNQLLLAATNRLKLEEQLRDEVGRSAEHKSQIQAQAEALARMERQNVDQAAEIKTSDAALSQLRQRFEVLQAKLMARAADPSFGTAATSELLDLRASIVSAADDALGLLQDAVPDATVRSRSGDLEADPANGKTAPRGAEALL